MQLFVTKDEVLMLADDYVVAVTLLQLSAYLPPGWELTGLWLPQLVSRWARSSPRWVLHGDSSPHLPIEGTLSKRHLLLD